MACGEQLAGVSRHARGAGLRVECAVCEAQDARRPREVCISPAILPHSKKFASSPGAQRKFCATPELLLPTAMTAVNHCSHNQRAHADWAY